MAVVLKFTAHVTNAGQASNIIFYTLMLAHESWRYVASLSVALALPHTGHMHSGYHKTLGHGLGTPVL